MSETAPRVDLRPDHLEIVQDILRRHLPARRVVAFGSRATWMAKEYSDLDLAILGDEPVPLDAVAALADGFSESDLPFKVDVAIWGDLDDRMRATIWRDGVDVQLVEVGALGSDARIPADRLHIATVAAETSIKPPRVSLRELVDLRLSSVDKKSKPTEAQVKLCNYTDVYYQSTIRKNMPFMDATASAREISKCTLLPGDVVITKDSEQYDDIGVPAFVMDEMPSLLCGYHLAILRPNVSRIHGRYLYYALSDRDAQSQFHHYANGITRFGLRKSDIGLVELPVPSLPEQQAIAHILGTLDDKIELNRRMNETLEAMARALFKSWFVDFEPVRAKMEGRDTGLPPHVAALFPNRMIDTELGETPDGWSREPLRSIVALNPESWNSKNPPACVTYIDLKNTKWGRIENRDSYAWENAPSRARRVLRSSDTVVGTVRPGNGSYALIDEDGLTGSTGFAVLRPLARIDREIVWCASTSKDNIERLAHLADGGAYPAVRAETVAATPIVLAADNVRQAFSELVGPLLERAAHARRESATLARLRDTLLPRLISGELRVAPAETPVAAAL